MLGLQNEREWKIFCDIVLQDPELATDPRFDANFRRVQNRDALRALILETFASLSTAEVMQRLEQGKIANARMNTMSELWQHPQLQARERWQPVATAKGEVPALLPPGRNSHYDYRMDPVPALGQHTEAILHELGRDAEAIADMRQAGAI